MKPNESLAVRKQDTFAARLRRVVREYPISARQWSVQAGRSSSQVGVLIKRHSESVNAKYEEETVRALAAAVGCTFEWLAKGEGEMTLDRRQNGVSVPTPPARRPVPQPRSGVTAGGSNSSITAIDERTERMMRLLRDNKFDVIDVVLATHRNVLSPDIVANAIAERERFSGLTPAAAVEMLSELHTLAQNMITKELQKRLP